MWRDRRLKAPLGSMRQPHDVQRLYRRLPVRLVTTLRNLRLIPTRFLLWVRVRDQTMQLLERATAPSVAPVGGAIYLLSKCYRVSTSRIGVGQQDGSNRTPLGLHRIAQKVGDGHPIGTVFRARRAAGLTWGGQPDAPIAHRILWLAGLEPGWNQGGDVDSFRRYIYIHGLGDELTLGRPASIGCVHLSAADLMPLFDRLPLGTLVWISC